MDWSGFPREQIHPGSTLDHYRAVALDDEYDRIRGTLSYTDIPTEVRIARGGPTEHPPTYSHNAGPALIADGTVYYRGGYQVMKGGMARALARGEAERIDAAQLCNSSLTEGFFGHWLLDTPALGVLGEQRGLTPVVVQTSTGSSHRSGYTAMLGTPMVETRLAVVDQLWSVDDRPTNAGRASRLREVRRRVRRGVSAEGPRRVIMDRKLGGVRRNLENSGALWDMLVREHGFEVVDPLEIDHVTLVAKLANAELVLGVEGSALCHAVVASPDGAMIFAIMPPTRFCTAVKWYTDMIGMKFGFAVASGTDSDFTVEVDRLRRVMEQVDTALARR